MVKSDVPVVFPVKEIMISARELTKLSQEPRPGFNVRPGALEILEDMKIKGGKGARRVGKLVTILRAELKVINEANNKLIESYGKLNEDGVSHSINREGDQESWEAYQTAYKDLMDDDVEIRFRPVCMGDFGSAELPMHLISSLAPFFDFEEDEIPDKEEPKAQEDSAQEAAD
jgi:hypothetical protein